MVGDEKREFMRHTVATLAYRGGKALRDAPDGFESTRAGPTTRSAIAIVAHLGDLLDWAVSLVRGEAKWKESEPRTWEEEVERFFTGLKALDDALASAAMPPPQLERIFQGPIADALTHVGQLATLRRLAGAPVRGENYFKAEIVTGRVGPEQTPPRYEF
jgi:hypothetical protein